MMAWGTYLLAHVSENNVLKASLPLLVASLLLLPAWSGSRDHP
jgi:hypothetical protein